MIAPPEIQGNQPINGKTCRERSYVPASKTTLAAGALSKLALDVVENRLQGVKRSHRRWLRRSTSPKQAPDCDESYSADMRLILTGTSDGFPAVQMEKPGALKVVITFPEVSRNPGVISCHPPPV